MTSLVDHSRVASNVVESLVEGCQVIGPDWRYLHLNSAAVAQARLPRTHLLGRTMMECYPGIEQTEMFAQLSRSMADRRYREMVNEFRYADGSRGWFELRFLPVPEGVCVLSLEVTEKKEAEARLAAAQEAHRILFEASPVPMLVIDLDEHAVLAGNDATLALYGYTRDELVGMPVKALRHDDEPTTIAGALERLGDRTTTGTVIHRKKDGSRLPLSYLSRPIEFGGKRARISVLEDVTARARAEEASRKAAMLDSAPDAIVIADAGGLITFVNTSAERLFGYSREEVRGVPLDQLLRPGSEPDRTGVRRDGSEFVAEVHLGPVRTGDGIVVASSIRDVTERRLEEASLSRAKEAAEDAQRHLEAFSYSVAHDLRAPLRGMSGFAKILLEDYREQLGADARDAIDEITSNAARMDGLITGLLSLSDVTTAGVEAREVDITQLAAEVLGAHASREPERRVEISIAPGLRVRMDDGLARAMLENLLGNAWKFTGKTPSARIEVGACEGGFYVRDNGAGFDMAHAAKLFTPFKRLCSEHDFEGTGIGLATVHRIVERHGGSIHVDAHPGVGATFYVSIP